MEIVFVSMYFLDNIIKIYFLQSDSEMLYHPLKGPTASAYNLGIRLHPGTSQSSNNFVDRCAGGARYMNEILMPTPRCNK